ncbi:UNVERIFIED_CONTAM: hypothetical protein Sindi_0960800, partial [Sesamum indicum]
MGATHNAPSAKGRSDNRPFKKWEMRCRHMGTIMVSPSKGARAVVHSLPLQKWETRQRPDGHNNGLSFRRGDGPLSTLLGDYCRPDPRRR